MTESGTNENGSANSNANEGTQKSTDNQTSDNGGAKVVSMTQEDLDRIISERLDKAKRSWDKAAADKQKAEEDKAAIDRLQGEEKLKKQHQIEVEKLQQERDTYQRELRIAKAETVLSSKGLDPQFASTLIGATDEETNANIDSFAKMVEAQVSKTIKATTAKGAPPVPNSTSSDPIKDQIMRGFGVQ